MRLYSPVDLTGNVNMIEKLVLGGKKEGGLNPSPASPRYPVTWMV